MSFSVETYNEFIAKITGIKDIDDAVVQNITEFICYVNEHFESLLKFFPSKRDDLANLDKRLSSMNLQSFCQNDTFCSFVLASDELKLRLATVNLRI